MEDLTRLSNEELEREQLQCRVELKFAKKLGRNPVLIMSRFNLLVRELNNRSGK